MQANTLLAFPNAIENESFAIDVIPAKPQTTLHINLFGDLRLTYGDGPATSPNSGREQSLLAYLVLHAGVPQSRRHLAFLLWPDSSDDQSRSNLRKLLHDLRRALPDIDRFIQSESSNLVWRANSPYTCDVAQFEQMVTHATNTLELRRAVALYQGPLFQSCYDDWVFPERERLHQMFISAVGRLIHLLETQGEYRAGIQYAQLLLQHDPLHEDVYRTLMRLYALCDDRAAALRTFQTCATVLKQELDVEPSPATQLAYDRLLHLKQAPAPHALTPAHSLTPLVGHSREWSRLQEAWRLVARGQPHWAMLTGAAGIGKTRLAEELLGWAAKQGIPTASARCYAAESRLGYGPITSWLRARPLPALDKVWLSELARLLPELVSQHPDLPAPGALTEPWQRLRFFEALARAILASQPLILLLDDVQYGDPDTLEWLHYLLRFNPQASLLLVSTVCLEEVAAEHPLNKLQAGLRRAGQLTEIGVQPLTPAETAELAAQVDGRVLDPQLAAKLYAETEGSPLFVLEMVRSGKLAEVGAPLPRTMQHVIASRLGQLSPATRELANVAAVIGRGFTLEILAKASGAGEEQLAKALAELRQKRIVRAPVGAGYDFDHSQLRQVAYGALNPAERQMWHRRVAEALVALGGAHPNGLSGEIVEHYERAGLVERAVPYQVLAGDVARRRYANETAIEYYRRALPFLPEAERGEIMLRIGHILELVGKWDEAEAFFHQALEVATRLNDTLLRARSEKALGDHMHRKGMDLEALTWLERAQRDFETLGHTKGIGKVFEVMGIIYDFLGDDPRALGYHQTRLGIAMEQKDNYGASRAMGNIGRVYWRQGNYARALNLHTRQFQIAQELDDRRGMAIALTQQGLVYHEQGDFANALAAYNRALEIQVEVGDPLVIAYIVGHIGRVYHGQGDHARALEHYARQLETMTELCALRGISHALRNFGLIYQDQGDYQRARACLGKSLEIGIEIGDRRIVSYTLADLALAFSREGQIKVAERLSAQALALLRDMHMPYYLSEHVYNTAWLNYSQKCYPEAEQFNTEAIRLARQINRKGVEFQGLVLAIRLRRAQNKIKPAAAVRELETLARDWKGENEQAALYYEMWRLDTTREIWRKTAAKLYRQLCLRTSKEIDRQRYEKLTHHRLAPPVLPDLPELVAHSTINLELLFKQVDRLKGTLGYKPRGN